MNVYIVTYFADGTVTTLEQIAADYNEAYWRARDTLAKQYDLYQIISIKLKETK